VSSLSSENERTFSDTRLIISDNRIRLGPDVVEALECLHHWKKEDCEGICHGRSHIWESANDFTEVKSFDLFVAHMGEGQGQILTESWTPDWSEEAYTQVVCGVYTRQSSMQGSKKLYV
jgi:hypothetical protein